MPNPPRTIIAVTTDDNRHRAVVDRAALLAREMNATVILYDLDADLGPFESPLPTAWSGDGEVEQFGDRLDPNDLETAGQGVLADQVRVIRVAGVDAYGWLPPNADAASLMEYAAKQGAELVLVSTDDTNLVDAFQATATGAAASKEPGDAGKAAPDGRVRVEAVPPS